MNTQKYKNYRFLFIRCESTPSTNKSTILQCLKVTYLNRYLLNYFSIYSAQKLFWFSFCCFIWIFVDFGLPWWSIFSYDGFFGKALFQKICSIYNVKKANFLITSAAPTSTLNAYFHQQKRAADSISSFRKTMHIWFWKTEWKCRIRRIIVFIGLGINHT